jgi:hypothetical protein
LLHGEDEGHHILMMTDEEYEKYGKRLFGIQEKGFKIQIVRSGHARTVRSRNTPKRSPPKRRAESRQARQAPSTKTIVENTINLPFLDERDTFGKGMILQILSSNFAKERGGLTLGEFRQVLDHNHVKYKKRYVRTVVEALYDDRKLAARREGTKRRYFRKEAE